MGTDGGVWRTDSNWVTTMLLGVENWNTKGPRPTTFVVGRGFPLHYLFPGAPVLGFVAAAAMPEQDEELEHE